MAKLLNLQVWFCLISLVVPIYCSCGPKYIHVNTGNLFANTDDIIGIACLDENGCATVEYLSNVCNGCGDPACTELNGNRVVFNNLSFREVVQVTRGDDISTINNGDIVCASEQVSVAGRRSTTLDRAHEWNPGSMAGTNFAYISPRGSSTTCVLFSFEGSSVDITEEGSPVENVIISAYESLVVGPYNAANRVLKIQADNPIVGSCYLGTVDFTLLIPVDSDNAYGYNSQNTRGIQVDCVTLDNALGGSEFPTCESSTGSSVAITLLGTFFRVDGESAAQYTGNAITCEPFAGTCIAIFTIGDGDGGDGTSWVRNNQLANTFVAPFDSQRFSIASNGTSATCEFKNSSGHVLDSVAITGTSTLVKDGRIATVYPQGTSIECTDPVTVAASFNDNEYNLYGLEDESLWSYVLHLDTCSPTTSPSTSPTISPTLSPSESPSSQPSSSPSQPPAVTPSESPTVSPSFSPTEEVISPTVSPNVSPSASPSSSPIVSPSTSPSTSPSLSPSESPNVVPSESPSLSPSQLPSVSPSHSPSVTPTTSEPSVSPTTSEPTISPTTSEPSVSPTHSPSASPTTSEPSVSPTTSMPSVSPTTSEPSVSPTPEPSVSPTTSEPSVSPTTSMPSVSPTDSPTDVQTPSMAPTGNGTEPANDVPVGPIVAAVTVTGFLVLAAALFLLYRRNSLPQMLVPGNDAKMVEKNNEDGMDDDAEKVEVANESTEITGGQQEEVTTSAPQQNTNENDSSSMKQGAGSGETNMEKLEAMQETLHQDGDETIEEITGGIPPIKPNAGIRIETVNNLQEIL